MYILYVWDTKQVILAMLVSCFALLEKPTINRCLSCRCLPCLLHSFRLPAWLAAPPVLTNLPFLPALGRLGTSCTAGGLEGVCEAQCAGQGLVRAGHCTRGQSVCCAEVSSCSSSLQSPTSYFTSPATPHTGGRCAAEISIPGNVCYLR